MHLFDQLIVLRSWLTRFTFIWTVSVLQDQWWQGLYGAGMIANGSSCNVTLLFAGQEPMRAGMFHHFTWIVPISFLVWPLYLSWLDLFVFFVLFVLCWISCSFLSLLLLCLAKPDIFFWTLAARIMTIAAVDCLLWLGTIVRIQESYSGLCWCIWPESNWFSPQLHSS